MKAILFGSMLVAAFVVAGIIKISEKVLDKRRREQYPEYFKLFDKAMDIVAEVDCRITRRY